MSKEDYDDLVDSISSALSGERVWSNYAAEFIKKDPSNVSNLLFKGRHDTNIEILKSCLEYIQEIQIEEE